jgi:hypothetical protein
MDLGGSSAFHALRPIFHRSRSSISPKVTLCQVHAPSASPAVLLRSAYMSRPVSRHRSLHLPASSTSILSAKSFSSKASSLLTVLLPTCRASQEVRVQGAPSASFLFHPSRSSLQKFSSGDPCTPPTHTQSTSRQWITQIDCDRRRARAARKLAPN